MCLEFRGKYLVITDKSSSLHLVSGNNSIYKCRSSFPEVFCKKLVLRDVAKFMGTQLCQSLYFNNVAGCGLLVLKDFVGKHNKTSYFGLKVLCRWESFEGVN